MTRAGVAQSAAAPLAALLGGAGSVIAARLVKNWWRVIPEHDVDDERYIFRATWLE